MGTRATYRVQGNYDTNIDFYIHWDGYFEGAADYFYNMATIKDIKGGWIEKFLVGNSKLASITNDYKLHGDTEYHYEVDPADDDLKAYSKNWDAEKFNLKYSGSLYDFIVKYSENGANLVMLEEGQYMRVDDVKEKFDFLYKQGKRSKESGGIGNASSYYADLLDLLDLLRSKEDFRFDNMVAQWDNIAKEYCDFAIDYNWQYPAAIKLGYMDPVDSSNRQRDTLRDEAYNKIPADKKAECEALAKKDWYIRMVKEKYNTSKGA